MPIDVEELKKTPEELLFRTKPNIIREKAIEFLKKNKGQAYLSIEITDELNKGKLVGDVKFNNSRVSQALTHLAKSETTNKFIKKKGSYYYYEDDKTNT